MPRAKRTPGSRYRKPRTYRFGRRRGLSLPDLLAKLPNEESARAYLERILWPHGPVCPHCQYPQSQLGVVEGVLGIDHTPHKHIKANPEKRVRPGLWKCGRCSKQFTVTVGTIFEKTRVSLHKWLLAAFLFASSKKGMSAMQIHRTIGVTYKTAWFMLHRLRHAMARLTDRPTSHSDYTLLGGDGRAVEADEVYLGGRRTGVKSGFKGNKIAVVSVVERRGRVRSMSSERVTTATLDKALETVRDDSVLMTDDLSLYRGVDRVFLAHRCVIHSAKQYVNGTTHTNTVEGFFANLRRGLDGIYHHVGQETLDQYLGEFDFRYNTRGLTDDERFDQMLSRGRGRRMTYKPAKGLVDAA